MENSSFILDFGEGFITVEMDDRDLFNETNQLQQGEKVTVYGLIDDAFYEAKKVEADMVYAHNRNTFFFASKEDEEGDSIYLRYGNFYPTKVPDGTWIGVLGTVRSVDGREFSLDTGASTITVDTAKLNYNPLDKEGYQQIEKGERIYASGLVDINIFDKKELDATNVITIQEGK